MLSKRTRTVGLSSLTCSSSKRRKLDRISQLPESILHHIMSFLVTKDDPATTRPPSKPWNAVTTRSVSKTWDTAWNSFPVLKFNQGEFYENYEKGSKISPKRKLQDFCNYVEYSISRHRKSDVSLQEFQIVIDLAGAGVYAVRVQDIIKWLEYAKTKKARTLSFHCLKSLKKCKDEWRYVLPTSLVCSQSLEELYLFGCKLLENRTRTTDIGSLKKLSLVHVQVDQLCLQSFLSSCCSVEKVSIQLCKGFETVKLSGAKLKEVDLVLSREKPQTIILEASNLQCLHYAGKWDNIKSSILTSDCKNLKEVMIQDSSLDKEIIFGHKFSSIEKLVLRRCRRSCADFPVYNPDTQPSVALKLSSIENVVVRRCTRPGTYFSDANTLPKNIELVIED